MEAEYYNNTNITITNMVERTTTFSHLQVQFNISLHREYDNFLVSFETGARYVPLPSFRCSATALMIFRDRLSFDAVQEAIGAAIGDSLRGDERGHAVWVAWKKLQRAFPQRGPLPRHVELVLDLEVFSRYMYVRVEGGDDSGMIPAAEDEIRMLEECDVAEEKRCCSICLEEIGAALRMHCSHVFHHRCIVYWLRMSHYCPLCRYQMATE